MPMLKITLTVMASISSTPSGMMIAATTGTQPPSRSG
jgi:hypothetical protein